MGTLYEVTPGEGIDPIKLSTGDRLALTPSDGLIVYDEDLDKLFVYNGTLWVDATAAGGGWTRVTESTGTRTAANNEFILINNASCIVTLPAPTDNTTIALKAIVIPVDIQIKTSGAGVDIDGTDYSVIGLTLTTIYEQVSLISNGTDWFIY